MCVLRMVPVEAKIENKGSDLFSRCLIGMGNGFVRC